MTTAILSVAKAPLTFSGVLATFLSRIVTPLLIAVLALGASAQGAEFSAATDMYAQDVYRAMQDEKIVLVDVRTPDEWRTTGLAQGAVPISMQDRDFLVKLGELTDANPGKPVAFICASGRRSGIVQAELARRGYENMYSVFGGTTGSSNAPGWIGEGLPVTPWNPN